MGIELGRAENNGPNLRKMCVDWYISPYIVLSQKFALFERNKDGLERNKDGLYK
jgi:hypothetical protein